MEKDFDAVKAMREIRDKLHKEYSKNPDLRRKRLEQIRKNLGLPKENSEKVFKKPTA